MKTLLTITLLFAQVQVSHFVRPAFPKNWEWVKQGKEPRTYEGSFVMPASGTWTLHYAKLHAGPYDGKTILALPQFCDNAECKANKLAIYDIDESLDHITVKSEPGSKWWYTLHLAVPKEEAKK